MGLYSSGNLRLGELALTSRSCRPSVAWGVVASAGAAVRSGAPCNCHHSKSDHPHWFIKASGYGHWAKAFKWWIRNLDHQLHAIAQLNRIVSKIAEAAKENDARQSARRWLNWLREGPATGLGRQHHMSRVAGSVSPWILVLWHIVAK